MKMPPLYTVGRVAGKHGFSGEVSLSAENDDYLNTLKKGDFLFVEFDKKGVPFLIEAISSGGKIVKLADINSEKDVLLLLGKTLFSIHQQEVVSTEWDGLIGFKICISGSNLIGKINQIEEYPSGPMLLVELNGNEIMIPIVEEWIVNINEENTTITFELPDGLLDL